MSEVHDEHEHEAVEGHTDESYFDVMSDPAHVMAEMTYEVFFFLLSTAILWWKSRRQDARHGEGDEGSVASIRVMGLSVPACRSLAPPA